jgi:hypothetical protein
MKTFDPYQPIEKVPLFTEGLDMQSKMYSVKMEIPVQTETERGNITTLQPYECGTVSEGFQLIPNSEVKLFSDDLIDSLPGTWETGKEMFDGSKYMMTQICKSGFGMSDLAVGDTISIGIMWRNAYDMTRSLSFDMFANVLSCLNGYTHNKWFTNFRFKHTPNNSNWKDVLNEAKQSIVFSADSIQDLAANLDNLNNINVDTTERLNTVRSYLDKDILGYTQWGKVVDRFITERPANGNNHTLWDMTQACTHTFWNSSKESNQINSWADLKTNENCVRKLASIEKLIVAES